MEPQKQQLLDSWIFEKLIPSLSKFLGELQTMTSPKAIIWEVAVAFQTIFFSQYLLCTRDTNRMIYAQFQYRVNKNRVSRVADLPVGGKVCYNWHRNKDAEATEWFVHVALSSHRCVRLIKYNRTLYTAYKG